MALVNYSDSGSSSSSNDAASSPLQTSSRKRKRTQKHDENGDNLLSPRPSTLPSLPSAFHSLYACNVRTTTRDDPTLHSGRTRQIPHVEGNWPTHIYLEWYPSPTELNTLTQLIASTKSILFNQEQTAKSEYQAIHTLLTSPLGAQSPLHISLSAPLVLQTHQRSTFLDALERAITTSSIKPFTVATRWLDWASNFDRTRWFLVLRLATPCRNELNRLLEICNGVVAQMGQPVLYGNAEKGRERCVQEVDNLGSGLPRGKKKKKGRAPGTVAGYPARHVAVEDRSQHFHISIAWTLHDPAAAEGGPPASAAATGTDKNGDDWTQNGGKNVIQVPVDVVKVKIGNAVHDIPLAKAAAAVATPAAASIK